MNGTLVLRIEIEFPAEHCNIYLLLLSFIRVSTTLYLKSLVGPSVRPSVHRLFLITDGGRFIYTMHDIEKKHNFFSPVLLMFPQSCSCLSSRSCLSALSSRYSVSATNAGFPSFGHSSTTGFPCLKLRMSLEFFPSVGESPQWSFKFSLVSFWDWLPEMVTPRL